MGTPPPVDITSADRVPDTASAVTYRVAKIGAFTLSIYDTWGRGPDGSSIKVTCGVTPNPEGWEHDPPVTERPRVNGVEIGSVTVVTTTKAIEFARAVRDQPDRHHHGWDLLRAHRVEKRSEHGVRLYGGEVPSITRDRVAALVAHLVEDYVSQPAYPAMVAAYAAMRAPDRLRQIDRDMAVIRAEIAEREERLNALTRQALDVEMGVPVATT